MPLVDLALNVLARLRGRRVANFRVYARRLEDRCGLEIGGPSRVFGDRGALPVYSVLGSLDNCVFSRDTVWSGSTEGAATFRYHPARPPGRQFILDMIDLKAIDDVSYDAVLASHVIEHVANPLKALGEAHRVLRPNGSLVLVVPHRDATFDHNRPLTTLEHLLDDQRADVAEDDLTHLDEVLERHDLAMDPDAGDADAFRRRSQDNPRNRCLHQHIFDTDLVVRMLDHAGWTLLSADPILPRHIIVLARKTSPDAHPDNEPFLSPHTPWRRRSPFKSDSL